MNIDNSEEILTIIDGDEKKIDVAIFQMATPFNICADLPKRIIDLKSETKYVQDKRNSGKNILSQS